MAEPIPELDPLDREGLDDGDSDDDSDSSGGGPALDGDPAERMEEKNKARRRRHVPEPLPEDDPFRLIDRLDATGGIDGTRTRMTPRAMAAFRLYCRMPPFQRNLHRLHQTAHWEEEVGGRPAYAMLSAWSKKYQWQELVKEFDSALARWRLYQEEQEREAINARQKRNGRVLQIQAAHQIQRMINEYNKPVPAPRIDPQTKRVIPSPKRSLAGLQALAMTYKIAVESERVAAGLPTTISDNHSNVSVDESAHVEVTLAEWRRHSMQERLDAGTVPLTPSSGLPARVVDADQPTGEAGTKDGPLPALPAPHRARRVAGDATLGSSGVQLDPAELDMLPEEWLDAYVAQELKDRDRQRAHDRNAVDPLSATGAQIVEADEE